MQIFNTYFKISSRFVNWYAAKIIDLVIEGFEDFVGFTIVSRNSEAIESAILQEMGGGATSERVAASHETKRIILTINEIYKKTKDSDLMEIMKHITVKKRKIEKHLNGYASI